MLRIPSPVLASAAAALALAGALLAARRLSPRRFWLVVILAAAALLRANQITQPFVDAFSWRQASTASIAESYFERGNGILYPEVGWTGPGPGYQGRELQTVTYAAAALYGLFGPHEAIGRALAAAFGLWGIFALHQLVRRVWDDQRALAAAALLAVLPGAVFVERSFLPDPAMVALLTTSFWLLAAALQNASRATLIAAAVVGAWGAATKLPGLAVGVPMAYAAVAILRSRGGLSPATLARLAALAACVLVAVAAYYLWALHLARSYPPYHFAGSGNWLWDAGIEEWWSERWFLPELLEHLRTWSWTDPVLALVVIGFLLVRRLPGPAPLAFHVWTLACGAYYVVGADELVTNPWNLHLLDPAAAALSAHALVSGGEALRAAARFAAPAARSALAWSLPALAAAYLGVSAPSTLAWLYHPYAADDYELGIALDAAAEPEDLVVTLGSDVGDPTSVYYSGRRGWVFPPARPGRSWGSLPRSDDEVLELLARLERDGARWLGIVDEQRQLLREHRPAIGAYLERRYLRHAQSPAWVIYRIPPVDEAGVRAPSHASAAPAAR